MHSVGIASEGGALRTKGASSVSTWRTAMVLGRIFWEFFFFGTPTPSNPFFLQRNLSPAETAEIGSGQPTPGPPPPPLSPLFPLSPLSPLSPLPPFHPLFPCPSFS